MRYTNLLFCLGLLFTSAAYCQITEPKEREDIGIRQLAKQQQTITIAGRLEEENRKDKKILLLHGRDAKTYQLVECLRTDELRTVLAEKKEKNMVQLRVWPNGDYTTHCRTTTNPEENAPQISETVCIKYIEVEPLVIIAAETSEEIMPLPQRDTQQEEKTHKALTVPVNNIPSQIMQKEITITATNLKSPFKTMSFSFLDKDNKKIEKTVILRPDTTITKKLPEDKEPVYVGMNYLKAGQKAMLVFSHNQAQEQAVAITITKE